MRMQSSFAGVKARPRSLSYEKQSSPRAAERVVSEARLPVTSEQRSKGVQRRRKWATADNIPPEIRGCYSEAGTRHPVRNRESLPKEGLLLSLS